MGYSGFAELEPGMGVGTTNVVPHCIPACHFKLHQMGTAGPGYDRSHSSFAQRAGDSEWGRVLWVIQAWPGWCCTLFPPFSLYPVSHPESLACSQVRQKPHQLCACVLRQCVAIQCGTGLAACWGLMVGEGMQRQGGGVLVLTFALSAFRLGMGNYLCQMAT